MSLAVGTYGLDNASSVDYGAASAAGSRFQMRYSSGANNNGSSSQFKLCKVGEIAEIVAAGTDFRANSEWYGTRVTEGANAGKADGQADLVFWGTRGLARGCSIIPSWDAAPNPAQYSAVEDYLGEFTEALEGEYFGDGLYAGLPALNWLATGGVINKGWIPSAASWSVPNSPLDPSYAPPAKTLWDLWFPTKSQVAPAIAMLASMCSPSLQSVVWQNGNKWANGSDENVIVRSGVMGSQMEQSGVTPPEPPTPPKPPVSTNPIHGMPVPSLIARGSGQYLGSIDGPAASHGGINANEQHWVKLWQQFCIWDGDVPGVTNVNSGWADGIFDVRGGGIGSATHGATSMATARFQHKHMPGTTYYGQVWWDDWTKAASL